MATPKLVLDLKVTEDGPPHNKVKILKSQSATQFTIYSTCRADFWEILLRCWLSKAAVENSQKSALQSWIYTVHWVSSWLSEILRRCLLLKRLSMANRWLSRRRARRRLPRRRFFFFPFLFLFAFPLQNSLKKRPAHFPKTLQQATLVYSINAYTS